MTMFKKIAKATAEILDELKWPAIESSVKRRIEDKVQDVKDEEDKRSSSRIDLIKNLGQTADRDGQEKIIDEIIALDRELFLVKQKAEFAKKLGEELFAKAE